VGAGILRGMGKTMPATVITIISYYGISIPLQMLFAFYFGLGLHGLWYAQILGTIFHCVSEQYLISCAYGDWSIIAREAVERMQRDQENLAIIKERFAKQHKLKSDVEMMEEGLVK